MVGPCHAMAELSSIPPRSRVLKANEWLVWSGNGADKLLSHKFFLPKKRYLPQPESSQYIFFKDQTVTGDINSLCSDLWLIVGLQNFVPKRLKWVFSIIAVYAAANLWEQPSQRALSWAAVGRQGQSWSTTYWSSLWWMHGKINKINFKTPTFAPKGSLCPSHTVTG